MSADGNAAALRKKIANRSREHCLRFVLSLSDKERRKLNGTALSALKEIDKERYDFSADRSRARQDSLRKQYENAGIAVICTSTFSELKKLGWRVLPGDDFIVPLIESLRPAWIDEWIEALVDDEPRTFTVARQLYAAGLCNKPNSDGYVLGMIVTMPMPGGLAARLWQEDQSLAKRISSTPDILEEDIWRLFDVEGGGDHSLAAADKYLGKWGKWSVALRQLSDDGVISRDRLLDETLRTLEKDFAQFRAGWFSRFHEELAPTPDERTSRRGQYLGLLGSSIPPTVSFALKALAIVEKNGGLPGAELLDHVEPVLQARAKGTVRKALGMIANAARRDPTLADRAALLAAHALIHEAADVQSAALDVVAKLGDTADSRLRSRLSDHAAGIAPSLRARFEELPGVSPGPDIVAADTGERAEGAFAHCRVEPIESFEALIRSLLQLLEDPRDPLAVERTLDGMCRFAAGRKSEALLGPVGKRAATIVERETNDPVRYHLARLANAWVFDEDLPPVDVFSYPVFPARRSCEPLLNTPPGFEMVLARRNTWMLDVIRQGKSCELLSAPSDSRGFVDASQLLGRLARLRERGIVPNDCDLALALMRLSPDDRPDGAECAARAAAQSDEYLAALALALGQDVARGPTDWLWLAAAAARLPGAGIEPAGPDGVGARHQLEFERRDPFTFLHVRVEPPIERDVPINHLARLLHVPGSRFGLVNVCGQHVNMIRWSSLAWPLNLEPFFAQGATVFDHSQRLANTPYAGFFEPLLEPHVRIGDMGAALLVLGLAGTDPAVKGLATEAAIAAIVEDRLEPDVFHGALATLLPSGYVPVGRWTKSFGELAAVSAVHAAFVRRAIAGALRHDPAEPPRDLGGLVELLYELQVADGAALDDREAIRYLSNVRSGGKLGRSAKKLLAL